MSVQMLGNQIVDQYPISGYTPAQMTYGLTSLPPDYATSTKTYPLIIHLHGQGEIGTGIGGLQTLINANPLQIPGRIAAGWNPSAINPVDKQTYEFIVVSPQGQYSSLAYPQLQYLLPDVLKRYRVDPTRIYITGLSNGGYGTWTCLTDSLPFAKQLAAIAPISAQPVEAVAQPGNIPRVANIANAASIGLPVWNICGSADGFIANAQQYTAEINAAKPIVPAILTTLQGVGHSAWQQAEDPAWTDPVMKINLFQWFLQYKLGGSVIIVPPIPVPTPTPKIVAEIDVKYTDGSTETVTSVTLVYTVGQPVTKS